MVPMKINRLYFNKLWNEIQEPKISILLGMRQVGKSTLLRQLEKKAKGAGYQTAFYDLEQPADLNLLAGDHQKVILQLNSSAQVVFIDEFHYLKNAPKIFKAIYDSGKPVKIYVSGSSSLEIHKHLKESLAGRFIKTIVHPLSLEEWKQIASFEEKEYLQWGGMPGLVHCPSKEDRITLLENIVSAYITKDIKGLIKEENIRSFNSLLYLLAQAQGSVGVISNLARETGLNESTLARYLEIMAQTYVLQIVSSYSQNLANELKKSKKYYLMDHGIRNMFLKDFRDIGQREDKGIMYESAIFFHLYLQLKSNMEIRFWRTKKGDEVDFVILKNRIPVPVEVKSYLPSPEVPKGMVQFLKRYPQAPFGLVYNANLKQKVKIDGRDVHFCLWSESVKLDYLQDVV